MKGLHLALLLIVLLANLLPLYTCDDTSPAPSPSSEGFFVDHDNCREDDLCHCYIYKMKKTCYSEESECLARAARHKRKPRRKKSHHHHPPAAPSVNCTEDPFNPDCTITPSPTEGPSSPEFSMPSSTDASFNLDFGMAPQPTMEPFPPEFRMPPVETDDPVAESQGRKSKFFL